MCISLIGLLTITIITAAFSVQVTGVAEKRSALFNMSEDKREAELASDILGALELAGQIPAAESTRLVRRKRSTDVARQNMETRTPDMNHIMEINEMGESCDQSKECKNLEEWKENIKSFCGYPTKCMNCKAVSNMKDMETSYTVDMTKQMVDWVQAMRKNAEWSEGNPRKRFFMAATKLSDGFMTKEKKDVSWYGAVRMTKTETKKMAQGGWRHPNFWIHITVCETPEEGGGTTWKPGYKFYRDAGNGAYADLIRHIAGKALKDKIIDTKEHGDMLRYSPINLGNIIESCMGYGFLSKNRKDDRLT